MGKVWAVIKYALIAAVGFLIAVLISRSKQNRAKIAENVINARENMRDKLNKKTDKEIVDSLPNADDIRKLLDSAGTKNDSSSSRDEKDDDSGIWRKGSIFH